MTSSAAPTRAALVHDQLRQDIFRGAVPPGRRLRLVELAERFSVSQSVVREALTRLAGQGLVIASPQQGFQVVTLSLEGLNELTEARCAIEPLTLRHAVERGDLRWESDVVATHHRLSMTPESIDGVPNEEWFEVHEQFHRSLLAGCGNGQLLTVALSLRDSAALYRHWAQPLGQRHARDVAAEHRELLDAVLHRDSVAAATRLADHIERTSEVLRSSASTAEA